MQRDDTTNTNLQSLVQSVGPPFKPSPIKNITVISQETTVDACSSETDITADHAQDENHGAKTPDTQEIQGLKNNLIQNLKMTHNLRHQDSLNSSGTISRKTSTASDYTPEHTVFPDKQQDTQEETQEFLVAELDSQDNSDPIKTESDIDLSGSTRDVSNTSLSTISGDCTIRRDSQPLINGDHEKIETDTNEANSNVSTGLTYAEVAKSPKKVPHEYLIRSDDDSVSVTSSQYTDTVTSLSDVSSGHSSSSEPRIGQKIELKICLLKQHENDEKNDSKEIGLEKSSPEKKIDEKTEETKLKVPQRKISRFLVSPVLEKLDLPKDKNYGENSEKPPENTQEQKQVVQQEKVEQIQDVDKVEITPNEIPETVVQNVDSSIAQQNVDTSVVQQVDTTIQNVDTTTAQQIVDTPVQQNVDTSENPLAQQDSIENIPTITETPVELKDSEGPVCGPEMINTLEQLKISLQNITHAQLATTVAQPATPQPTITQPVLTSKPKQSVVEPPSGLYPVQNDMLLSIDTQSTSAVPTPIITPTLSRQMSHSSTEPGLSTVTTTGFQNETLHDYQQGQVYVQQPDFVQQNEVYVQPNVQQANIQQENQVYTQTGQPQIVQTGQQGVQTTQSISQPMVQTKSVQQIVQPEKMLPPTQQNVQAVPPVQQNTSQTVQPTQQNVQPQIVQQTTSETQVYVPDNQVYQPIQPVQQTTVVQQPTIHQQATVQQTPTVLQQATVNQTILPDVQTDLYQNTDNVQQLYVHNQSANVPPSEGTESSDSRSDLTSDDSNSSVNTPDSTTLQQITSPERYLEFYYY